MKVIPIGALRKPSSREEYRAQIVRVRAAIRWHRDQKGDDRCWADDEYLYHIALGRPKMVALIPKEEFMRRCGVFHERRNGPPMLALANAYLENPNTDLDALDEAAMTRERDRLMRGVSRHERKGEDKTDADDQQLYMLLPEQELGDCSLSASYLTNWDHRYECKASQVAAGCPLNMREW